ncbi:hypothetical protein [Robertmurraya kyonggiensis]|uniref:Uncharacterized protein n=1 Tax=Robertmurraya kyonggiensis TaxID=1037680 RepID=A0A4U1D151_9BACI|nr:hypothetical protein [Robertmurraya kyonggiensis]TKC15478.1 hypothetical protein FA727_18840 [Robertmurraya kyonggiensis]
MRRKILIVSSIFLLLFSLAWFWDGQHKREFYDPMIGLENEDVLEILPISNPVQSVPRKYKIFKAREYVRIEEL